MTKLNLVSPENLIFRNNRLLAKRGEKKFIEYKELMNSHAHNNNKDTEGYIYMN